MNRSSRTFFVLAVAVITAGIAAYGVLRVVSQLPARQAKVTTVDTVVASHPLPLGARLTRDDVKIVSWPAESPVPGAFAKVEDVIDRGVITAVNENEPLTESRLAPLESGAGLPPSIPEGMRAISVKVNEVVGVAGFVVPGTQVDVLVTLRSKQKDEQSMSRVVVGNVKVLTAGTRYDQEQAKEGTPMPSTVVTLLVTPEDGERIALAASEGQIMLTLRNPLDRAPTVTPGVRTAGLFGTAEEKKPVMRAVRASAPAPAPEPVPVVITGPYKVEAIRGAKRTEEVVK